MLCYVMLCYVVNVAGIEYGDMQLIAECYDILRNIAGMDNEAIADTFAEWNTSELASYLIEITAVIVNFKDDRSVSSSSGAASGVSDKGYLLDKILDKTGMKGTGRWAVQEAAERNVAAPTIAAALDARYLSGDQVSISLLSFSSCFISVLLLFVVLYRTQRRASGGQSHLAGSCRSAVGEEGASGARCEGRSVRCKDLLLCPGPLSHSSCF